MISSFPVLSSGTENDFTQISDEAMAARCGSSYCPAQLDTSENTEESDNDNFDTDISEIYTIAAIYLGCSFSAALVVALFVSPLTR